MRAKGSVCMCHVTVSNWRQITSRWSAFTRAHQNIAPDSEMGVGFVGPCFQGGVPSAKDK